MAEISKKEVGRRIAQARKETEGMTQRELGDLVGVTERSVAEWEAGGVIPYRHMRRLEEILSKPASWLLYGDDGQPAGLQQQLSEIHTMLDEVLKRLDGRRTRRKTA